MDELEFIDKLYDLLSGNKSPYCFVVAWVKIENKSITDIDWVIQRLGNLDEEQIKIDLKEMDFIGEQKDGFYELKGLFSIEYDHDDFTSWEHLNDIIKIDLNFMCTIEENDTEINFEDLTL